MTHVVYGYPSIEDSIRLMETLLESGVELLEIQFPFSDPIADGPSILNACHKAINHRPQLDHCLKAIESFKQRFPNSRILLMSYLNPLYRYGLSKLVKEAATGVSGLIIPDLPLEQAEQYRKDCELAGIDPIWLITPDTPESRLVQHCEAATGMLYCVSRRGVTGKTDSQKEDSKQIPTTTVSLRDYLGLVAEKSTVPLAVGFGIRERHQITMLQGLADVAIVGSALLDAYDNGGLRQIRQLITTLRGKN
ncbi:tryptophan synthase subunit alpha [Motiliproteus sp. MSK22-1]|nr:tryptophan synthase subunit alpha [Motiliproteus sp. MSK22-1]